MVTINDIAKLAGVAKSTISRYLNGGSVSPATRIKIERIMKETDYIPNTFAQSLKIKKSNLVGIVIPRLNSYATYEVLESIDRSLKNHHFQLLIANTDQNVDREVEQILAFSKQKVAAVILLATVITQKHREVIEKLDFPVLVIGQRCNFTYSFVYDEISAAKRLGEYVVSLGHREILFLGVNETDEAVGILRKQGFLQAITGVKGIAFTYKEVDFNYDVTYQLLKDYLKSVHPTYIVCATDNIALAAFKASIFHGKKVPTDVSISGFGGYSITDLVTPAITTVKYPYKEVGTLAVNQLMRILQGEIIAMETVLPCFLLPKESTRSI